MVSRDQGLPVSGTTLQCGFLTVYLVHLTQVSLIVITELCSPFFLGPKIKIGALEIQSRSVLDFLR